MRVWFRYHGLVVDIYYLPGVSVGFAFDVAAFGVVHFARSLLCACGDFACDFQHVIGHFSPFGYYNRVLAVFVFEVKPYIVGRCDFECEFIVLYIVFPATHIKSVHKIDIGWFGFFFAHLIF